MSSNKLKKKKEEKKDFFLGLLRLCGFQAPSQKDLLVLNSTDASWCQSWLCRRVVGKTRSTHDVIWEVNFADSLTARNDLPLKYGTENTHQSTCGASSFCWSWTAWLSLPHFPLFLVTIRTNFCSADFQLSGALMQQNTQAATCRWRTRPMMRWQTKNQVKSLILRLTWRQSLLSECCCTYTEGFFEWCFSVLEGCLEVLHRITQVGLSFHPVLHPVQSLFI